MRGILLLIVILLASDAFAAQKARNVVIYRCTGTDGAVTIQNNVPCPKGARQQKRVIAPPPAPAPVPSAAAAVARPTPRMNPAPAATAVAVAPELPAIAEADRLPPPALFRCNTYDNDSYLSDTGTPGARCVRLNTTGINGSSDMGAGEACQMVTDQCERVADGAVCAGWIEQRKQLEAAWKFGRGEVAEANRIEYERVDRLVRESTCGK